jgi:hypothetical protein
MMPYVYCGIIERKPEYVKNVTKGMMLYPGGTRLCTLNPPPALDSSAIA